jgi:hypothetical protein
MWEPVRPSATASTAKAPAASTANEPPAAHDPPAAPSPTPAVQRCCAAYQHALATFKHPDNAKDAFKNALPFLTDRGSILDFIACITQGMVLRVFWADEGPKLIVAAKAALSALPSASGPVSRPGGRPKNPEPPQ